ncbi:unnamed protein product, partial [marine sediment metagenome]
MFIAISGKNASVISSVSLYRTGFIGAIIDTAFESRNASIKSFDFSFFPVLQEFNKTNDFD